MALDKQLPKNMFVLGCQSDNVYQFIKFIGILATMNWSATPPPHHSNVNKEGKESDN